MSELPDFKIKRAEKAVAAFRKCLLRSLARNGDGVVVYRVTTNNGGVRGMTEHLESDQGQVRL